jgi:hypothetical protein
LTQQSERTGIENKWFALRGRVVALKAETDGDLHIALQRARISMRALLRWVAFLGLLHDQSLCRTRHRDLLFENCGFVAPSEVRQQKAGSSESQFPAIDLPDAGV